MFAVLRTLIEGSKQDKKRAIRELRLRLELQGYDTNHKPDPKNDAYLRGAEICVVLSNQVNNREGEISEIRAITQQLANQFGFTPLDIELAYEDNNSVLAYCGFLK